jgi:epoxyqueuosine reductase
VRFARDLEEGSPFASREVIAGKDARTLAREILAMSQEEFAAAFRHSPMKRAKLRGLKRNAAVVLGNIGTMEDVPVLEQALDNPEPLVREHAAWILGRLLSRVAASTRLDRLEIEADRAVREEVTAVLDTRTPVGS